MMRDGFASGECDGGWQRYAWSAYGVRKGAGSLWDFDFPSSNEGMRGKLVRFQGTLGEVVINLRTHVARDIDTAHMFGIHRPGDCTDHWLGFGFEVSSHAQSYATAENAVLQCDRMTYVWRCNVSYFDYLEGKTWARIEVCHRGNM